MDRREVLVVGGGPAGAAVSIHLRRRGHEVTLLEKAHLPRPKPCGEALSPEATPLLAELGVLGTLLAEPYGSLHGFQVFPYGAPPFRGTYAARARGVQARATGLGIPRLRLDRVLLDAARAEGVDVREGWSVQRAGPWEGRARLVGGRDAGGEPFSMRASLLIGADGVHSLVARRLGLARPSRRLRQVAIVAHVRGIADLGSHGEMHVIAGGYCGIAPLGGDLANVGMVVPAARLAGDACTTEAHPEGTRHGECMEKPGRLWPASLVGAAHGAGEDRGGMAPAGHPRTEVADERRRGTARALAFLCAELGRYPHLAGRLEGATLVAGPWTTSGLACGVRRRADDGLLLIGDAGGYFDPFTGEGIFRALRGAALAAEAADAALRRGDMRGAALRPFALRYGREFVPKRLVELIVHEVTTRQAVFAHVATRLRRRPALANALVGVTGDFLSPYEVLSPWYLARLFL